MTIIIKSTFDKEYIKKTLSNLQLSGKFNSKKYCGKIKLQEDPMIIQKNMRDEW
jgi:hypothetical protein